MKQNIKRIWLALCMAVCFFALTACGSSEQAEAEPVPADIASTMETGAEGYLREFDSYDDATLAAMLKKVQRQKNTVMESAITSWQTSKADLGRLVSIDSKTVERLDEYSYGVTVRATFEKRGLEFYLSAEETESSYGMGTALVPTEILFTPDYTTGEKLAKAGMNTLMGMGTVFLVLIFISLLISSFKNINKLETAMKARKAAKDAPAPAPAPAATPAPAPVPTPAPAPAPVQETMVEEDLEDGELTAVIAAAIAAYESEAAAEAAQAAETAPEEKSVVPVEGLVVRSIKRKPGASWKKS